MRAGEESVVLVEGYDDRSFWQGLLLRGGCKDARKQPPSKHRQQGGYTYVTPSSAFIHVIPCMPTPTDANPGASPGDIPTDANPEASIGDPFLMITRNKLREQATKPLRMLVLGPDGDRHASLADAIKSARTIVTGVYPDAEETPEGDFVVDKGRFTVATAFLHADSARKQDGGLPDGVPAQRALEQLVCAALCKAYPDRGEVVSRWLANRPTPGGKDHKAHAWSFYAGWWTGHGTGDFFSSLWRDPSIANILENLLRAQGTWRIIEALLAPPAP